MPHRQRVTISDVAAAAGVSKTTVSHVLNGKGRVESATRERVLTAAARLRYRPNAMARGTRSGISHLLGLVVPAERTPDAWAGLTNELFAQMTLAATRTAAERGFSIVLVPTDLQHPDIGHLLCDGVIDPDPRPGDRLMHALRAWKVPTVITTPPPPEFDDGWWVGLDPLAWSTTVFDHLRDAGATSIAIVGPQTMRLGHEELERSIDLWGATHGVRLQRVPLLAADGAVCPIGLNALRKLLSSDQRPDALATIGYGADAVAVHIARDLGLRVPEDLLVASFIDTEASRRSDPPITAIEPPVAAAVTAAVELLIDRLNGAPKPASPPRVTATLAQRESTHRQNP